jgi:hypothetical protein
MTNEIPGRSVFSGLRLPARTGDWQTIGTLENILRFSRFSQAECNSANDGFRHVVSRRTERSLDFGHQLGWTAVLGFHGAEPQTRRPMFFWVAPLAASDSAKSITSHGSLGYPTWSPDGRIVYSSSADGNIWLMESDGSNPKQLTSNAGRNFLPRVSPDGGSVSTD